MAGSLPAVALLALTSFAALATGCAVDRTPTPPEADAGPGADAADGSADSASTAETPAADSAAPPLASRNFEPCAVLGAGGVRALGHSADGRTVAVGYGDGSLQIHDPVSGQLRRRIPAFSTAVSAASLSDDGLQLAVASDDHLALFAVDATSGDVPRWRAPTVGPIRRLRFSPDGALLLVSIGRQEVALHRTSDGSRRALLPPVADAVFSQAGRSLVGIGEAGELLFLDLEGAVISRAVPGDHPLYEEITLAPASDLALFVDQRVVENRLTVRRLPDGAWLWDAASQGPVTVASFLPTVGALAVVGRDRTRLYRLTDGAVIGDMATPWLSDAEVYDDKLRGPTLAWVDHDGRPAAMPFSTAVISETPPMVPGPTGPLLSLAISGDGQTLAAVGTTDLFWLWDLKSPGTPLPEAHQQVEGQWNVAFTAGPSTMGLLGLSGDAAALMDRTGKHLWWRDIPSDLTIEAEGYVTHLALSPDGQLIAVGDPDRVSLYTVASGKAIRTLPTRLRSPGVAFSPDGAHLATAAGELWRTSDWTRLVPDPAAGEPGPPESQGRTDHWVAFSADGQQLVLSECGRLSPGFTRQGCPTPVRVLSVPDGRPLRTFAPPVGRRPVFSPDGSALVAGDRLLDLTTGENRALPVPATLSAVTLSTFGADGRLYAAQESGVMKVLCPR